MLRPFFYVSLIVSSLIWSGAEVYALDVPPHTRQVIDLANILDDQEQDRIENSLKLFQKEYGPQLQVLTIPSLEGEAIESYSIKVVDAWKLGDEKRDDGLLLLVVPQDRRVRIEVGQGLEGVLPDVLAGRIIRDVMFPFFKEGRYDAGIVAGLNAIAGRLGGTLKEIPTFAPSRQVQHTKNVPITTLLFLFILFFFILPRIFGGGSGRYYSGRRRGGFIFGDPFGSSRGRDRDGGFGGFGGFGGGGGGGFSGGGSSGKW
jgi:uncharacterized protein